MQIPPLFSFDRSSSYFHVFAVHYSETFVSFLGMMFIKKMLKYSDSMTEKL